MKARSFLLTIPRGRLAAALAAVALWSAWAATPESHSQAPASAMDARTAEFLGNLVGQLKSQQDHLAENQTRIEAQTAALKEELRLLKIYSARGGSSRR